VRTRELEWRDEDALRRFFQAIPAPDHAFFKEDIEDPAVLRRWVDDERGIRIVAVDDDGDIAAIAAVWPGIGRSSHVGDLRLVVAAGQRRQGLGRRMARLALAEALRRGIWKISVEVVSTQQGTIDMFLGLGFVPEALLRDQLCSPDGRTDDVVLLSHLADEAGQDARLAAPDEIVA
jgi:GNAT superfamily N-acetyltransferase